ncbi:flagellar motor switch phosphatase FliY [Paenibacillus gallinarum]|uniref:Flagellar motor switch phosphatase FliY n=1 Tax=Paenibacillus gallinarum TaxID=2762232 RepID=A0ABR8SV96_9BACL|nr:flagellar motor switch phosphatase FliY [Paenibacillus gallinarum]MBD7967228.1 flagellar motor switch phosphatase FliY [Paenibacillus gallinarum]
MTSKDFLSQEEIDALLKQTESISSGEPVVQTVDDYLTPLEQDALGEIGNITFGSAATALSTLLGNKVDITTPKISIIKRSEFEQEFPKPHVTVHVTYVDGFEGINSLVIKKRDAQVIADLMLGGEGNPKDEELNEIHISAVQEAMNQMMGSSATSMSTLFNRFVNISPPSIDILNTTSGEGLNNFPVDETMIKVSFRLLIGDLIDSTIMQLLRVDFSKDMVRMLIHGTEEMEEVSTGNVTETMAPVEEAVSAPPQPATYESPAYEQPMHQAEENVPYQDPWQAPIPQQQNPYQNYPNQGMQQPAQMSNPEPQHYGNMHARGVNVQPVQFANFQNGAFGQPSDNNLNLLMDIPLKVTVELGRTQKQIKDILELSQGSIIELDKLAGEPVDILVNQKLIAKGEVVVIDENFGVRVTDIVSEWDRLQKIQ